MLGVMLCGRATGQAVQRMGKVEVVAVTPLPGLEVPPSQVPANVQTAQPDKVRKLHGGSFTNLLHDYFQGVDITQSQGNPWQANLIFHGFALSPLLGSPAGISVYVDGVRQNESFAQTMNWEAIPEFAISSVELIPGSSPQYGRNTLGGAIVLTTKSGFSAPGGEMRASGGSWNRLRENLEYGWHGRHFGIYAGASNSQENGWRAHSPSHVQQTFLRGDWRPDDMTSVALTYTGAHAKLFGTQTIPAAWAGTPKAAFTWPDYFVNNLSQVNLLGSHQLNAAWSMQAEVYERVSQSRGFDSDTADFDAYDAHADGPLGYAVDGPFDPDSIGRFFYSGVTPAYDPRNPRATINNVVAANALANVHTRAYGGRFQIVDDASIGGRENRLSVGVDVHAGNTLFTQFLQPAYFPYDVGARGQTVGLLPFASAPLTHADTSVRDYGIHVVDILALTRTVHATFGARYDHGRISVRDLGGWEPRINGTNTFHRLNPSIGLTWAITSTTGAYANYDEGTRFPSPIELECASPQAPCALPNDFTGDPPLEPVIAHTFSAGLRGTLADGRLRWNVSPYHVRVDHAILTIFTGTGSQGYFANIPHTLREGLDAGIGSAAGRLRWQIHYSYVRAVYGAGFDEQSEFNSSADADGVIRVHTGDRLPGVPRNAVTMAAEYVADPTWSFGADLRAYSNQYATGDENNHDMHGKVPGYAVVDIDMHYHPTERLSFFLKITNLFDRHYFVSGQLSDNIFDTPDRLIDSRSAGTPALFVAPGAPRGLFVGLRYRFADTADHD